MAPGKFAHPLFVELQNSPVPLLEPGLEELVQDYPDGVSEWPTVRDDPEWYKRHFKTVTRWSPDAVDRLSNYLLASHVFFSPDETYRLTWEIAVNQNKQMALEFARLESEVMLSAKKAIRSVLDKVRHCGAELERLYKAYQAENKILFTEYAARTYLHGEKHLLLLFRTFRSVALNCSLAQETVNESGCSLLSDKGILSREELQNTSSALKGTFEILTLENTEIAGYSKSIANDYLMVGSRLVSKKLSRGYEDIRINLSSVEAGLEFKRPDLGMVLGVTQVSLGGLEFTVLGEVRTVFHASKETRLIFCSRHEVVMVEGLSVMLRVRSNESALPRYLDESNEVFIPGGSGEIWTITHDGQIYKYSQRGEMVSALQFGKDIQHEIVTHSERLFENLRPVPPPEIEIAEDPLLATPIENLFLGTAGDYRQKSKYPKNLRDLIDRGPRGLIELGISKRTITNLEARFPRLIREAWGDVQWSTAKVNAELSAMRAAGFNVSRDGYVEEISHSPSSSESLRFKSFTPIRSWTYSDECGLCLRIAEGLTIRLSRIPNRFQIDVPPISERYHRISGRTQGGSTGAESVDFMTYRFSKSELRLLEIYSQSFANFRDGLTIYS